MSTSRNVSGSPTSKMLSSCVRPGVLDVRASEFRPVNALSSDDLPTLDRPANAISGTAGSGRKLRSGGSEEHTSELQSLMRNSYAVFCLKKKNDKFARIGTRDSNK